MEEAGQHGTGRVGSERGIAPRCPVVRAGAADMRSHEEVARLFVACCESLRERPVGLTVDLRAVQVADTKLAAALVAVYRNGRAAIVRVELQLSTEVRTLLSVCRLHALIEQTSSAPPAGERR